MSPVIWTLICSKGGTGEVRSRGRGIVSTGADDHRGASDEETDSGRHASDGDEDAQPPDRAAQVVPLGHPPGRGLHHRVAEQRQGKGEGDEKEADDPLRGAAAQNGIEAVIA